MRAYPPCLRTFPDDMDCCARGGVARSAVAPTLRSARARLPTAAGQITPGATFVAAVPDRRTVGQPWWLPQGGHKVRPHGWTKRRSPPRGGNSARRYKLKGRTAVGQSRGRTLFGPTVTLPTPASALHALLRWRCKGS